MSVIGDFWKHSIWSRSAGNVFPADRVETLFPLVYPGNIINSIVSGLNKAKLFKNISKVRVLLQQER